MKTRYRQQLMKTNLAPRLARIRIKTMNIIPQLILMDPEIKKSFIYIEVYCLLYTPYFHFADWIKLNTIKLICKGKNRILRLKRWNKMIWKRWEINQWKKMDRELIKWWFRWFFNKFTYYWIWTSLERLFMANGIERYLLFWEIKIEMAVNLCLISWPCGDNIKMV